jgi:hypothetical protein
VLLALALTVLTACGGGSGSNLNVPLSTGNVNLVFVVSPDLAYQAPGDVNPATGNLTSQGLQRSLLLATYLKQRVLGGTNVSGIYALEPMTHLQTAGSFPDMAAIGYIQQFALLNQITLASSPGLPSYTCNSYPINASYASGPLPAGVATPFFSCAGCQGLDFSNTLGSNDALVSRIVDGRVPGFYVFCAPWETIRPLMAAIDRNKGYGLSLPAAYTGPNDVYAISITPAGGASLVSYHADLNPPPTYPVLPADVPGTSCTAQTPFTITRTGGVGGNIIPAGINTNETVYMIRHAEAHPASGWDDGNFIGAGQWRALALPSALRGKISPDAVYSIDPAQVYPGSLAVPGNLDFSYVRPSLTVEPYAIANSLPFYLVSDLEIFDPTSPQTTSAYFFFGGRFSNRTILLAWEHNHFPPIVNALLAAYGGSGQTAPAWPSADYDTIWRVTLDGSGNVTVDNVLCEGIDSARLPATAPLF